MVKQYDIVLVSLDPTVGVEYQKTRPCVVISPNDMNNSLRTVVIAPMTSTCRGWLFRPLITGPRHQSELALDQMRAIDKSRIKKTLGSLAEADQNIVHQKLQEFFL